jgi:pSer/pThr/pTyr-binding forkhead associated (FHA) protein
MTAPLVPRLRWERKDGSFAEFPIDRAVLVVGRDESCDIVIDEPLVSRAHARLERRGDRYFVLDIGSTNSTRVNGDAVAERELHHGDEVTFSRARCFFLKEGPDPVAGGV